MARFTCDSYSEANYSTNISLNNTTHASGQSFTGDGKKLYSCKFYLQRGGNPGRLIAYLYAHQGVFGTNSTPTGAALDTSDPIEASTISNAAFELIEFTGFSEYTMANGTNYVIVIAQYDGTWDATNYVLVGLDNTAPSHAGNWCYYTAAWNANNAYDQIFYVTSIEYPAPPTGLAATDGSHLDLVRLTWTKSGDGVDYEVYRDDVSLGWVGDVATYDDEDADPPVITPGMIHATRNRYFNSVKVTLTSESIAVGTTHTYKVRTKDADGDESADTDPDDGYRGAADIYYQLQRSATDSDANYSDVSGAITDKYFDYDAPTYPTGRYYKYKLSSEQASDVYSNAARGYRRNPTLPPVAAKPDIIIKNLDGDTLLRVMDAGQISTDDSVNILNKMSFSIPSDSDARDYLDEDYEFWLYFDNELVHIYKIGTIESLSPGLKKVSCVSIGHALKKNIILAGYSCTQANEKTASDVLTDILAYQEVEAITLGGVIMPKSETYIAVTVPAGTDVWEACKIVREITGGYLTIEVDPENPSSRELYLRDVIGEQTGQQLRFEKNLTGLNHSQNYLSLYNRLYPKGTGAVYLTDIDYTRVNTEPEIDDTYAYIRLRNLYEAYKDWTAEGDALPGNVTIEKPTGNWFDPNQFTSHDQINPPYGYGMGWADAIDAKMEYAYDDNLNTHARCGTIFTNPIWPGYYTKELRLFCPATTTSQLLIQGWVGGQTGIATASLIIKVQADGSWEEVYNGSFGGEVGVNSLVAYFSSRDVTGISFTFYNWSGYRIMIWIFEANLWDPTGLIDDTANWKQGEDERTCRIAIGSYSDVGYVISYTHAAYLIDLDGITDRRQIRSKYEEISTTDTNELIARGRQMLTEGNKPVNSVEVDLIDLSQFEKYDFDELKIGSILRVIHNKLGIDEDQQLVRIVRPDLYRPELVQVELAARTKTIVDMF